MASAVSALEMAEGLDPGFADRYTAAAPATCGEAIDVPLIVAVAVVLVMYADVMDDPGALMSTHVPQFEKEDLASVLVVEATVMAVGVLAGERSHASVFSFPAATAYVTPAATEFATAFLSADEKPPPRLLLATALAAWFFFKLSC